MRKKRARTLIGEFKKGERSGTIKNFDRVRNLRWLHSEHKKRMPEGVDLPNRLNDENAS